MSLTKIIKYSIFNLLSIFLLLTAFSSAQAQNQKAESEIKKTRNSCQKNGCTDYALFQLEQDVDRLDQPNGTVIDRLKNQIVLPLNSETWALADGTTQVWYEIKTLSGQTGWIAETNKKVPTENNFVGLSQITDEEKQAILETQKENKKVKKLNEAEMIKKIEEGRDYYLQSVHEIKKLFNVSIPYFKNGRLLFIDKSYETTHAFTFKNCESLIGLMIDQLKSKNYGTAPFEISANSLLTFKGTSPVTDNFKDSCLEVVDNNEVLCGNSDYFYEKLVSKVGPLVTFERGTMASGGCGPTYTSVYFETYDLKTGKAAEITDYFEESELIRALKNDDYVKNYFERSKIKDPKLVDYISTLVLSGFAVFESKLHDGRMRLRWATAPTSCGMCLNSYSFVGLDVKPKPEFLELFKKLDFKKEMFLHENIGSLNTGS